MCVTNVNQLIDSTVSNTFVFKLAWSTNYISTKGIGFVKQIRKYCVKIHAFKL